MPVRSYPGLPGLPGLYAKVLRQAVPLIGARGATATGAGAPTLRVEAITIDRAQLAAYRRVCGFTAGPDVPVTYPQVLTFPLQLDLLTDPTFPFTALGAVHVANMIRTLRPIDPAAPVDVDVRGTAPRPHRRGSQLDVVTEVRQYDEVVWTSSATVLHLQHGASADPATPPTTDPDSNASPDATVPEQVPWGPQVWRLSSGVGRAYAAVSGDRNPIHLYDVTAMPLGFRHHIAHGMWTKARCLAELANRLPDSYEVTVAFRKPVPLPGSVRFGARVLGDRHDFGLSTVDGDSSYVLGRIRP